MRFKFREFLEDIACKFQGTSKSKIRCLNCNNRFTVFNYSTATILNCFACEKYKIENKIKFYVSVPTIELENNKVIHYSF